MKDQESKELQVLRGKSTIERFGKGWNYRTGNKNGTGLSIDEEHNWRHLISGIWYLENDEGLVGTILKSSRCSEGLENDQVKCLGEKVQENGLEKGGTKERVKNWNLFIN